MPTPAVGPREQVPPLSGPCARYVSTPAFPAHDPDARAQRLAAGAAKRKAEAALVALHKRQAALLPAATRPAPGEDRPDSAVRPPAQQHALP